jgi:hypothetical protein
MAISLAEDNEGTRGERIKLRPAVVEHLRRLPGFRPVIFPEDHNKRTRWTEFARLREADGIKLSCNQDPNYTRCSHVHGFHDLRRALATMNADKLILARCKRTCGTRTSR